MKTTTIKLILFILPISILVSACAPPPTPPILTITDVSKVDFSKLDEMKKGEDCSYYVFGLVGPFGPQALSNAVKKGNISKVKALDYFKG